MHKTVFLWIIGSLGLVSQGTAPAYAIDFPLTPAQTHEAILFGEQAPTQSAFITQNEWQVPCTSDGDAEQLLIETPFVTVAESAFASRDDAGYVAKARAVASLVNSTGRLNVSTSVTNSLIEENTDPLFVVRQGLLTVRSRHPKVGLADAIDTNFLRSISATFDLRKFDPRRDFQIVISNINDSGRTQLTYNVHPQSLR